MHIKFIWIGKTKDKNIQSIIVEYSKRLTHYSKYSILELKEIKSKSRDSQSLKKEEAELILSKITSSDYVVLLDEKGKHFTSVEYAKWIQNKLNISIGNLVLIIAGALGAHTTLKGRADLIMSLSHLTMTHDMARIFILEQTYRAFTILKGEKYHNS